MMEKVLSFEGAMGIEGEGELELGRAGWGWERVIVLDRGREREVRA